MLLDYVHNVVLQQNPRTTNQSKMKMAVMYRQGFQQMWEYQVQQIQH